MTQTQIIKKLEVASPDIFTPEELFSLRTSEYAFVPVKPLRCVVIKQKYVQGHFQEELSGSWSYHFNSTLSHEGRDVFRIHGHAETLQQAIGAVEGALKGAGFEPALPDRPKKVAEIPEHIEVIPASDLLE